MIEILPCASQAVAEFRGEMEQQGLDCLIHTPLPEFVAQVDFIGPFQGRLVKWNMTLATLEYFRRNEQDTNSYLCPFIRIESDQDGVFSLRVGLELERIDEPVVRKTLVMIRKYRRLEIGTLEFCPQLYKG